MLHEFSNPKSSFKSKFSLPRSLKTASSSLIVGCGFAFTLIILVMGLLWMYPSIPPTTQALPHTTESSALSIPPGMFPGTDFTVSAWVQLSRAVLRDECIISCNGFQLEVLSSGHISFSVHAETHAMEAKTLVYRSRTALKRGNWHHVAAVYANRGGGMIVIDGLGDHVPYDIDSNRPFGTPIRITTPISIGSCYDSNGNGNDNLESDANALDVPKTSIFGGRIIHTRIEPEAHYAHTIRATMFYVDHESQDNRLISEPDILALRQIWQESFTELYRTDSLEQHQFQPVTANLEMVEVEVDDEDVDNAVDGDPDSITKRVEMRDHRKAMVVIVPVDDVQGLRAPQKWTKACDKPHEDEAALNVDLVFWHSSSETMKYKDYYPVPMCFSNVHHLLAPGLPELPRTVPWHNDDASCWLFYSMFESEFLANGYRYAFLIDSSVKPVRTGWLKRVVDEVVVSQPFEDFWLKGYVNPNSDPEHSFVHAPPALYALGDVEFNTVIKVVYDRFRLARAHGGGGRSGGCHCGSHHGVGGPALCIRKYLISEEAFATAQSTMHMWRHHDLVGAANDDSIPENVYFVSNR